MARLNTIRFCTEDFNALTAHLEMAGEDESFVYTLCSRTPVGKTDIYICKQIILPGKGELEDQSHVSVKPERQYQTVAYGLAHDQGLSLVDVHTHMFSDNARFSGIDDHHGTINAKYIGDHFPESSTMGMIVLGRGFDNFEARIWNRDKARFEPVHRIEIHGSPTTILTQSSQNLVTVENDPYARHRIIPGWQQGRLQNLNVFLCGLGGNGALILDSLLALGIGNIVACDPDTLEVSNLPRIPYAYPEEVGMPKAAIAQIHADNRAPNLNVKCFNKGIEDDQMQNMVKKANIIIGAVDNHGARMIMNGLASRYAIPLIDLGTEIIPADSEYEAIGQVQIFVPGQTGCLMCSGALDPSEAALDRMSEEDNAQYENVGYVRGTDETPTPSVLHLNGVVSHLAISQLLRLVFNDGFKGKEFMHYNRQNASILTASVNRNDDCPVCGVHGYLGSGDEDAKIALQDLSDLQDGEAFSKI